MFDTLSTKKGNFWVPSAQKLAIFRFLVVLFLLVTPFVISGCSVTRFKQIRSKEIKKTSLEMLVIKIESSRFSLEIILIRKRYLAPQVSINFLRYGSRKIEWTRIWFWIPILMRASLDKCKQLGPNAFIGLRMLL